MGTKNLNQLLQQATKPALISIKPRYVEKILTGEKMLEFRRIWAASPVDAIAIYSSSPVQRIVCIAYIKAIHHGSPTFLWELAKKKGGGVSRRQLYSYFKGKRTGFAIELEGIMKVSDELDPKSLFVNFRPPQSFHYLKLGDYKKILASGREEISEWQ